MWPGLKCFCSHFRIQKPRIQVTVECGGKTNNEEFHGSHTNEWAFIYKHKELLRAIEEATPKTRRVKRPRVANECEKAPDHPEDDSEESENYG